MTAAVYLARFCRRTALFHDGDSRARWIPLTRNVPGYPGGIEGRDLLERLRAQVARYAVETIPARVDALAADAGAFRISSGAQSWSARQVILATGVHDRVPAELHKLWSHVHHGLVRLCPVCDAYELRGKRVGILARGRHAALEARFLAAYASSLAVFTHGETLSGALAAAVKLYAAELFASPIVDAVGGAGIELRLQDGQRLRLDALYVGLGVEIHSGLASGLGARCSEEGYLEVDRRQCTSVPGLYAAGDVVQSLSQISVAFGQAAIAASAVNLALSEADAPRGGSAAA